MINVALVDDHPVVRNAVRELLQMQPDMQVAGEGANAVDALALVSLAGLHVLVLDLDLPGRSGLDALTMLRGNAPGVGVVIFTGYPSEQYAVKLFRQGARAFINKSSEPSELVNAVRVVASGKHYMSASDADLLAPAAPNARSSPHDGLTNRELQILLKLARGVHTERIAENLALSVKTISTYRTRLLDKLELSTNSELTYYALKHRLLE